METLVREKSNLLQRDRQCTTEILKHKFEARNSALAEELVEAEFYSLVHSLGKQQQLNKRALKQLCDFDRAEKAIRVARKRGIEAKPFAVRSGPDDVPFSVRSVDKTWLVFPGSKSRVRVPVRFLRVLNVLQEQQLVPDAIAIAKPCPLISLQSIVTSELRDSWEAVTDSIKGSFEAIADAVRQSNVIKYLKDPVLLLCYGRYYIEAGRWI